MQGQKSVGSRFSDTNLSSFIYRAPSLTEKMRLVTLLATVALGVAVHAVSTMRINKTALMIATMRAELVREPQE